MQSNLEVKLDHDIKDFCRSLTLREQKVYFFIMSWLWLKMDLELIWLPGSQKHPQWCFFSLWFHLSGAWRSHLYFVHKGFVHKEAQFNPEKMMETSAALHGVLNTTFRVGGPFNTLGGTPGGNVAGMPGGVPNPLLGGTMYLWTIVW